MQLNSDYIRGKELDIQGLFIKTDMSKLVDMEYPDVPANIEKAKKLLQDAQEPDKKFSMACKKPYVCTFGQYCSRNLPKPSVFDLYRIRFDKALSYYKNDIVTFEDVQSSKLTGIQHLYFLDFETVQDVIAQYEGTKPYQQITFQYSLHWIESPGGELKHTAFFGESVDMKLRRE